jgi:hypothetical protein
LTRPARFEPQNAPPPAFTNPEPLPGLDLFLDHSAGWLLAMIEGLTGGPGPWPAELWPPLPEGPPPAGVSFVWALDVPAAASRLSAALPPNENLLLVSESPQALAAAARLARPGEALALSRQAVHPELAAVSLPARLNERRQARERAVAEARAKLTAHQKIEKATEEKIRALARLASLRRDLERLKAEGRQRLDEWARGQESFEQAAELWERSRPDQASGWLTFLTRRREAARSREQTRARGDLDRAETDLRATRLEIESLLAEARRLEAELEETAAATTGWPSARRLDDELAALKTEGRRLLEQAAAVSRTPSETEEILAVAAAARLFLASPGWTTQGSLDPDRVFDNVALAAPCVPNQRARQALVQEAGRARRRLTVTADFTGWSWTAPPPVQDGAPAWRCFTAAAPRSKPSWPLAELLGPLPDLAGPDGRLWLEPRPERRPWLRELGLTGGLGRLALPLAQGPTLRAPDQIGPICPATAWAAVQLAAQASRLAAAAGDQPGPERPAAYLLAPSAGQARLLRAFLEDFGRPAGVYAGEPADFDQWPPAAMALIDTALNAPGADHPWKAAGPARAAFLRALTLAAGAVVATGAPEAFEAWAEGRPAPKAPAGQAASSQEAQLEGRPQKAPSEAPQETPSEAQSAPSQPLSKASQDPPLLARLWRALTDRASAPRAHGPRPFWPDLLDQAKESVTLALPPFDPAWWPTLEPRLLGALRRRVETTVLAALPPEDQRAYPGEAVRSLRLHGAQTILAQGFDGFLAVIDRRWLATGSAADLAGLARRWPTPAAEVPRAAALTLEFLQQRATREKLGSTAPRNCPLCGWPHLLINQRRPRHFGDRQPLKLGCLNPACANHKKPRRLDERWPWTDVPTCRLRPTLNYRLTAGGKEARWVCPEHPDQCPSWPAVPGDPPDPARG